MGIRIDQHDAVTFGVGGADVTLASREVTRLWLEKMLRESEPKLLHASPAIAPYGVPLIGRPWKDGNGIYAGMARGLDGAAEYPLVVGPEASGRLDFAGAQAFAVDHPGWRLMLRHEAWLCKANVPELFKDEWYWTGVPYEGGAGYAWAQYFSYGNQGYYRKDFECRVRLVRSISVID